VRSFGSRPSRRYRPLQYLRQRDFAPLKEEVFGPHVVIIPYDTLEEAIFIHNDTTFGLAGGIISDDWREIREFRQEAEIGLAYANLPTIGAEVHLPFGGVKKSLCRRYCKGLYRRDGLDPKLRTGNQDGARIKIIQRTHKQPFGVAFSYYSLYNRANGNRTEASHAL